MTGAIGCLPFMAPEGNIEKEASKERLTITLLFSL